MNFNRSGWFVLSIASLVALGCTKSGSDNASPTGSASATVDALSSSAIPSAHKPRGVFGHHGGIAGSLLRAAHDLDLKEGPNDSLDIIEGSLKADDEGVRRAMKACQRRMSS